MSFEREGSQAAWLIHNDKAQKVVFEAHLTDSEDTPDGTGWDHTLYLVNPVTGLLTEHDGGVYSGYDDVSELEAVIPEYLPEGFGDFNIEQIPYELFEHRLEASEGLRESFSLPASGEVPRGYETLDELKVALAESGLEDWEIREEVDEMQAVSGVVAKGTKLYAAENGVGKGGVADLAEVAREMEESKGGEGSRPRSDDQREAVPGVEHQGVTL